MGAYRDVGKKLGKPAVEFIRLEVFLMVLQRAASLRRLKSSCTRVISIA
jgi:hypothetical protein